MKLKYRRKRKYAMKEKLLNLYRKIFGKSLSKLIMG